MFREQKSIFPLIKTKKMWKREQSEKKKEENNKIAKIGGTAHWPFRLVCVFYLLFVRSTTRFFCASLLFAFFVVVFVAETIFLSLYRNMLIRLGFINSHSNGWAAAAATCNGNDITNWKTNVGVRWVVVRKTNKNETLFTLIRGRWCWVSSAAMVAVGLSEALKENWRQYEAS